MSWFDFHIDILKDSKSLRLATSIIQCHNALIVCLSQVGFIYGWEVILGVMQSDTMDRIFWIERLTILLRCYGFVLTDSLLIQVHLYTSYSGYCR